MLINFSEVYIYTDQPTTCPKSGDRTEIILDLSQTKDTTQIHKCQNERCAFEFVMQYDADFDKGLVL